MILEAYLNGHGFNELLAGGSVAGSSVAQNNFLIKVLLDVHEYDVSAAVDPVQGRANYTINKKNSRGYSEKASLPKQQEVVSKVTGVTSSDKA